MFIVYFLVSTRFKTVVQYEKTISIWRWIFHDNSCEWVHGQQRASKATGKMSFNMKTEFPLLLLTLMKIWFKSEILQTPVSCQSDENFWIKSDGKVLQNYALLVVNDIRYMECLMKCSSSKMCKSINYSSDNMLCILNSKDSSDASSMYEARDRWTYYERAMAPEKVVHGGWTAFSEWSTCSQSCNGGMQSRTRSCTNPTPSRLGFPCMEGKDTESRTCNEWILCADPSLSFPGCELAVGEGNGGTKLIIGLLTEPLACVTSCFQRQATDPTINGVTVDSATGKFCYCEKGMTGTNIATSSFRSCKFGDIVNGGWTDFSEWSTCSQPCNGGTQTRTRSCTNPQPNRFGNPCIGETEESRVCNYWTVCADQSLSFSGCEVAIGEGTGGTKLRIGVLSDPKACVTSCFQRQATDPNINGMTLDSATGKICYCEKGMTDLNISTSSLRSCKFGDIVNGGWTDFNEWSTCSQPCDGGTQLRTRSCTSPSPNRYGNPCDGNSSESRICNEMYCATVPPAPSFTGCNFMVGDGIGGSEIRIGNFADPSACVTACLGMRASDSTINGATVDSATGQNCYCERGMTGANTSSAWRTCIIA